MKRSLLLAASVIGATAAVLFLAGLIPHGPDITRQRVETDLAAVWPNQYALLHRLRGTQSPRGIRAQVSCDKGGPHVADSGPGRNWVCYVRYAARGQTASNRIRYEVIVRSEACYTATDPALIENPFVNDRHTGASVGNPLYQFDGCFDVYDNRTATTS